MEITAILHEKKFLRDIDLYFARAIADSFEIPDGELLFALAFAATGSGHTCLDLDRADIFDFYDEYRTEIDEALEQAEGLLQKGVICRAPCTDAPFILQGRRLYMKSFFSDESSLSEYISRSVSVCVPADMEKLTGLLDKYFSGHSMQKAAALNAALNKMTVISGGPGTGKTFTVFGLLAVLSGMSETPLKTAVCAPTGKAASRLTETIASKKDEYKNEDFINNIPEKAVTIHRLLGITGSASGTKHGKDNKLPYDIVVADEASMIDVRMMAKLTDALADGCRLILLGDKDQLASVQPGAVLGDICQAAPVEVFSQSRAEILVQVSGRELSAADSPYADITILLDKSYRYDSEKGIGLLAAACVKGDASTVLDVLKNDPTSHVDYIEYGEDFPEIISRMTVEQFRKYTEPASPEKCIEEFEKFRILAPHRKAPGGTEHINSIALRALFRAGLYDNTSRFYHGMPVMITENSYSQNLFNGETGLILGADELKAYFMQDGDRARGITPARLQGFVPAYSMTVHKSQGSEFDHVVFVLPDTESPIHTRELFYTAVTRAKSRLTVIGNDDTVRRCLKGRTVRSSGLFTD